MVDLYEHDDGIHANAYDEAGEASAHVELYFAGSARESLKLLARVCIAVLVAARKRDGVHG